MKLEIQQLCKDDISSASQLIDRAFTESVAPTLTDEGICTFKAGITPESIEKRLLSGNTLIICKNKNTIVGVGEIRDYNHLNLLFVEPCLQRNGIGRKLLLNLINSVTQSEITGIKYQPMVYVKNITIKLTPTILSLLGW